MAGWLIIERWCSFGVTLLVAGYSAGTSGFMHPQSDWVVDNLVDGLLNVYCNGNSTLRYFLNSSIA